MKHCVVLLGLSLILATSFVWASTEVQTVGETSVYKSTYYADPQDSKGVSTEVSSQINSHIWIGSPLTISTSLKGDSSEETVILSPKIHLKSGTHLKGRAIRIKSL